MYYHSKTIHSSSHTWKLVETRCVPPGWSFEVEPFDLFWNLKLVFWLVSNGNLCWCPVRLVSSKAAVNVILADLSYQHRWGQHDFRLGLKEWQSLSDDTNNDFLFRRQLTNIKKSKSKSLAFDSWWWLRNGRMWSNFFLQSRHFECLETRICF